MSVAPRGRRRAPIANRKAREFLRKADPVLGSDHVTTENELIEVSDRWRPYRSLAVSYLFASEYDG